ncbi:MAG: Mut7-C RNAse domain-containing protein [Candidatus Omnitrophica bacterium]|nr:Mut7-C RNAse domain-containing protein [Candidatus Omnitrophota bacterium]
MRFIVTREAGKLARWLRILGFDTVYYQQSALPKLIVTALREDRIIITRKTDMPGLKKCIVVLSSKELASQLRELKNKLDLKVRTDKMFTRCTLCNQLLKAIKKDKARFKVPEKVYLENEFFSICPVCDKIYWQGSHWGKIQEVVKLVYSS